MARRKQQGTCSDCGGGMTWSVDVALSLFRQLLSEAHVASGMEFQDLPCQDAWFKGVLAGAIAAEPVISALGEPGLRAVLDRVLVERPTYL
jgi:hypothetical protein